MHFHENLPFCFDDAVSASLPMNGTRGSQAKIRISTQNSLFFARACRLPSLVVPTPGSSVALRALVVAANSRVYRVLSKNSMKIPGSENDSRKSQVSEILLQ